jgi:hypothetical protein
MPSFDAGFYHLTALLPLRSDGGPTPDWSWNGLSTSASSSLRLLLASLRTVDEPRSSKEIEAGDSPARPVPFSGNQRTHFARLTVINNVAYNGRKQGDTVFSLLRDRVLQEPQINDPEQPDQLEHAYLALLIDFDAVDGRRQTVENYLHELWQGMEEEWTLIMRHCRGFNNDSRQRQNSFVDMIVHHEIESTFTFANYRWPADPAEKDGLWPSSVQPPARVHGLAWFGLLLVCLLLLGVGLIALVVILGRDGLNSVQGEGFQLEKLAWLMLIEASLLAGALLSWRKFLEVAYKPWPTRHGTDLRSVLKSLYLQQHLTEWLEQQQTSGGNHPMPSLRQSFRAFLKEHQPHNLESATLRPGSNQVAAKPSPPEA